MVLSATITAALGLITSLISLCSANFTIYPLLEEAGCPWSDWQCRTEKAVPYPNCILYQEKNCSTEPYLQKVYSATQQTLMGVLCSFTFTQKFCRSKPSYSTSSKIGPQWCQWLPWMHWRYACVDAVMEEYPWLAEFFTNFTKRQQNGAIWLKMRSRTCACPGQYNVPCTGFGLQAALSPELDELEARQLSANRLSAWCPWSAWSSNCDCSSEYLKSSSAAPVRERSRVCLSSTVSTTPCLGSSSDRQSCRCDRTSPPSGIRNISFRSIIVKVIALAVVILIVCVVLRSFKQRRNQELQEQQPEQQFEQLLPAVSIQPANPTAPVNDESSLTSPPQPPPPSYEEAIKLAARQ